MVDFKNFNPKSFKFSKMIANAFTFEIFKEKFLPNLQKLIRKNSHNTRLLLQALICNIDFSDVKKKKLIFINFFI